MAKQSNVNNHNNTHPYPHINSGELRAAAEKHGNSGANKQLNAAQARSEAVRHGSLGPNEQISASELRAVAQSHGTSSAAAANKHDRQIAAVDTETGSAKGGR